MQFLYAHRPNKGYVRNAITLALFAISANENQYIDLLQYPISVACQEQQLHRHSEHYTYLSSFLTSLYLYDYIIYQ